MWFNFGKFFYKNLKRGMSENEIDMEELRKLTLEGATLIDVRSPQEYREGHINGAICIPEYELCYRCKKELENKDKTVILYCSSGRRSRKAQKELTKLGYTRVYNLYEGIENYNENF